MQSPDYEIITSSPAIHTGRLVPVYPETKGITSKWMRRQTYNLLKENLNQFIEYLPDSTLAAYSLISISEAIEQIHFPQRLENAEKSRQRLAFDELFLLQISAMERKLNWNKNLISNAFEVEKFKPETDKFLSKLPFTLTGAQKRVIAEIFNDLSKTKPMNRLLEGDV